MVYRKELIENQMQYHEDFLKQLHREVNLLRNSDWKNDERLFNPSQMLPTSSDLTPKEFSSIFSKLMDETDAQAARKFSIYADVAKTNGYEYQASLVEKNEIPKVMICIQELKNEMEEFEREAADLRGGLLKCKKWKYMAQEVMMADEYDYIYSATSRLLHCTPASVTTNQKNLEPVEVGIFLRYIYIKFRDIIELALSSLNAGYEFNSNSRLRGVIHILWRILPPPAYHASIITNKGFASVILFKTFDPVRSLKLMNPSFFLFQIGYCAFG